MLLSNYPKLKMLSSPFCASVLLITKRGPANINILPKFRIFQTFLDLKLSLWFYTLICSNSFRYSVYRTEVANLNETFFDITDLATSLNNLNSL